MRTLARVGLVALAAGLAACDATDPTSTGPALREGAPISITGTTSIAVAGLDGRLVTRATREWALDGTVSKGIADAEKLRASNAPMPYLAITDDNVLAKAGMSNRNERDRSGNTHDFVVSGDKGPAKTIAHIQNGKIDQLYSMEWTKVRGGWLAKSFGVTFYKDGKPVARITSSNKKLAPQQPSHMIATDDECWYNIECDPSEEVFYDCTCTKELQDYLAAAFAVAAMTQRAIDSGTILEPWMAMAIAAATTYVIIKLNRYQQCYTYCQRFSTDAGSVIQPLLGPARPELVMRA